MKKIILLTLAILAGFRMVAQSPDAFKYQAVVRDGSGALLKNSAVTIQIDILQGTATGPVVYSESHNTSTNQFGLVNLDIGTGTGISGSLASIDWSNGPYFIQISINGVAMGTSQLLSVPYAKYADTAGNLFNGDYNSLTNKPVLFDGSWSSLTGTPGFSTVALSGSYNDLQNKPGYDGTWGMILNKPTFASVATSGAYSGLTGNPVLFSGNYNDLTNKPVLFDGTWVSLAGKPAFPTVAMSGSYNDLIDKPVLFSGKYTDLVDTPILVNWTWNLITGKPSFATVATTGRFNDLTDKPAIFSGNYNDLTNKPNLFDGTWGSLTGKPALAQVATSGDYQDLSNLPALFSGNYTDLTNKPSLFSGDYNDLANKPVLYDGSWSALPGKPSFLAIATSGSYNDLTNTPTGLFDGKWSSLTHTPTTLAGYGITDAMSTSSPAYGITGTLISEWETAYGWGNSDTMHYGYAANYYTKKELQTSDSAQIHWDNITNKPTTLAGYGITDFAVTAPSDGQILRYNATSGKWENWTPDYGQQQLSLAGGTLTVSGNGNLVNFTNWDMNSSADMLLTGDQTVAGNKTFLDTLKVTGSVITHGVNGNGNKIANVGTPVNPQDVANKAYVDALEAEYNALLNLYNTLMSNIVMDYDGNIYKTVKIGNQVWMAHNLETTHFNNGDPIPTAPADTQLYYKTQPEFQWPADDNDSNLAVYGRVYTWYAANDSRGVCPIGWHIPSLAEFDTLINNAGGNQAGDNLKVPGNENWSVVMHVSGSDTTYYYNNGNNKYGFNWVGNGIRYSNCFACPGETFRKYGCLNTSTSISDSVAYHIHAVNSYSQLEIDSASYHPKVIAIAIRCLKN